MRPRPLAAATAVGLALAPWLGTPAGAQSSTAPPLRLLRCMPERDIACLQTDLSLSLPEARAAGAIDSAEESRHWQGRVPGVRLIGPALYGSEESVPPLRLLILMDVSGSMRGQGIAFTRTTLKAFVAKLPRRSVRVAVAPFESRRVTGPIARAEFVEPAEAVKRLDGLPSPQAAGNTALYTALNEGVKLVSGEVQKSSAPVRGAMLVVTDGLNDVGHRRDDPGLLSGAEGRKRVTEAVARSSLPVWMIGVGETLEEVELRALAGSQGEAYIIRLDPNLLEQRLSAIRRQLSPSRELTFGLPLAATAALARLPAHGVVQLQTSTSGTAMVSRPVRWQPPLFAAPAYQGVVDLTRLPTSFRDLIGVMEPPLLRQWPLLVLASLWVMVVVLVPRVFWAPVAASDAARPPAPPPVAVPVPEKPAPAPVAPSGGLRRDVQEAPPRRPSDVTAAAARRVGKVP